MVTSRVKWQESESLCRSHCIRCSSEMSLSIRPKSTRKENHWGASRKCQPHSETPSFLPYENHCFQCLSSLFWFGFFFFFNLSEVTLFPSHTLDRVEYISSLWSSTGSAYSISVEFKQQRRQEQTSEGGKVWICVGLP